MANEPILYVKRGCPYCAAAMDYLDQHEITYKKIDVRGNPAGMEELKRISGQTKTPTLVLNGNVLADFEISQLERFLASQQDRR